MPAVPPYNDALNNLPELLRQAATGDKIAFTKLYKVWNAKVYSVSLTITHDTSMAEELVQDVFLKLWIKREILSEVKDFESYLFIMTRNFALQALRKIALFQKANSFLQKNSLPFLALEDELDEKELARILKEAVRRLPDRQQEVYRLIKEKGMTADAVAEVLSISRYTVKEHLKMAMRSIRAYVSARIDLPLVLLLLKMLS